MAATVEVKCKRCKQPFTARVADRKRGWGKFCSKSCKAVVQDRSAGDDQRIRAANGGMGPREFQREFGGIPQFNGRGEYQGFLSGGFDNTAHQDHDD